MLPILTKDKILRVGVSLQEMIQLYVTLAQLTLFFFDDIRCIALVQYYLIQVNSTLKLRSHEHLPELLYFVLFHDDRVDLSRWIPILDFDEPMQPSLLLRSNELCHFGNLVFGQFTAQLKDIILDLLHKNVASLLNLSLAFLLLMPSFIFLQELVLAEFGH